MPFYGKHTLQRVYPSWTAAKRNSMDRYIQVAHGKLFLAQLRDILNNRRLGRKKPVGKIASGTRKNTGKSKGDKMIPQDTPFETRYGRKFLSQSRLENKEGSVGAMMPPPGKEETTVPVRRGKQANEKKLTEQGESLNLTPQSSTEYGKKKKDKTVQDTSYVGSKAELTGEPKSRYPIRTRLRAISSVDDTGKDSSVLSSKDMSQGTFPTNEAGITKSKPSKLQRLNRGNEVQVKEHSDRSCKEVPRKLRQDHTSRKDVKKPGQSKKQFHQTTGDDDLQVDAEGFSQEEQSGMIVTNEGNFSGDKVGKKRVNEKKLKSKRKVYVKKTRPYSKPTTPQDTETVSDQLQPDITSSMKGDRPEDETCLGVERRSDALEDQQSKAANPRKEATEIDHLQKEEHAPMFQKIEPLNVGLIPATKKDAVYDGTHPNRHNCMEKRGFSVQAGGSKPQRSICEYSQHGESWQENNVPSASNAGFADLGGSSSFESSSFAARKILGLRKTARKCCLHQSRHTKEKVETPCSDLFAKRVSVDVVKLKGPVASCPEESTPVKVGSSVSGIFPKTKDVSLPKTPKSLSRAEDEGKAEGQDKGFEHGKVMSPDCATVTIPNWENNSNLEKSAHAWEPSMKGRSLPAGNAGALTAVGLISKTQVLALQHDSSSAFGLEHNLVSRCSRCEEVLSSKSSKGQLSEKKENEEDLNVIDGRGNDGVQVGNKAVNSFDKNLWDLAVIGDLADGPLLEDDESSTADGGTKTPVSLCYQRFDEGSQELARCSETRPLEEENDNKDDSFINESVEDGKSTSPVENVLPGLAHIHRDAASGNRSPVIEVISHRKTDCPNDRSVKRNKAAESWDVCDDKLKAAASFPRELSSDLNKTSTASMECGHKDKDDASKTNKVELLEEEYRSQTVLPRASVGNTCAVLQLPDQNKGESAIMSRRDGYDKETTCSSAMLDSGMRDQPQIRKKIRTPAEKKQGWSEPDPSLAPAEEKSKKNSAIFIDNDLYLGGKLTQSPKKRKRSASGEDRVRGYGGWEESLRQKPATVAKFQVGGAQKSAKKSESYQEKKRWQNEILSGSAQQRQSPLKATSPPAPAMDVKQQSPAKAFRQVWKPPPAKKLKLAEHADDHQMVDKLAESSNQQVLTSCEPGPTQDKFHLSEMIWGKMKGFNWWPGVVIHHYTCGRDAAGSDACWVKWFGDGKYSKLNLTQVVSFAEFSTHFSQSTFLHTALYRRGVFEALELASARAGRNYSSDPAEFKADIPKRSRRSNPEWLKFYNLCNEMIGWAKEGFEPGGLKSILPTKEDQQPPARPPSPAPPPSPVQTTPTKRSGRSPSKAASQWKDTRDVVMIEISNGTREIEDICIGCGSFAVTAQHPFFVGGLCEVCRIEFLEVAYVFDEDGYQAFCCICAEGNDVILCDQAECYRSFCHDCLDYLVGSGTVHTVLAQDHWTCYMCNPEPTTGLLSRRPDWPQKLLLFFQQDCNQDFPPLPTYPPVEIEQRKPIRVLSLFDGIGTGMLVLKELGIKVDCYYASEISEEAIQVSTVRHDGVIKQLNDVRNITENEMESLGHFDLLIGGSPCNDLSLANPARKGLFEGTGRLFFEFYRLLSMVRPPVNSPRPFFWFFENVVGMPHKDKLDISRFLGCAPVVVDAKEVSPAHRARYFWGNLPGMNRPNVATNNNSLCLQDCLEPNCNRQAQFLKVRTVTSKLNSVKQKNEQVLPVMMNGQADTLWCTEMERIFGFPEHYTDIANMSRTSRHKLIGQAWSVPVIKHLLAPLKEYFACETAL